MYSKFIGKCLKGGSVIALTVGSMAAQSKDVAFDIAEQPLANALINFSEQADVMVMAAGNLTAGYVAPTVHGDLKPQAAFQKLLSRSGLDYDINGSGTYLVKASNTYTSAAAASPKPNAYAGASKDSDRGMEVITVTAQKRESAIQDVAAALTVVGGDLLSKRGVTDFSDLVHEVAGLSISSAFGGPSYSKLSIRGVGGQDDYRPNGSPSVALHVDNIYQTSNVYLAMPLFDLERVEVLKGPQGTLYGRNTTAGVVNAITRGATEEFSGYVDAEYGSDSYLSIEGAVGGPVSDRVGFRFAVLTEHGGGFMHGKGAGRFGGTSKDPAILAVTDPGEREGYGDKDLFAARGTVEIEVAEESSLTLKFFHSKDRGDTRLPDRLHMDEDPYRASLNADEDDDPYTFYTKEYYAQQVDITGFSASLNHVIDDNLNLDVVLGTQSSDRQIGGNGDGSSFRRFQYTFYDKLDQSSVEVRLSDDAGGDLDWIAGVYYLTDSTDFLSEFDSSDNLLTTYTTDHSQRRTSYAAFGQFDYRIAPKLTLSAGVRVTKDESTYKGENIDQDPYGLSTYTTTFGTQTPFSWDEDFSDDNFSGRVTAKYDISEDMNVFFSVASGYKAGGFDGTSIFSPAEAAPFQSETVLAYEAGYRWFSPSGSFNFSLDAFLYKFDDMQATARNSTDTNVRSNVAEVELKGVEAALMARLIESGSHSLVFDASVTFLESEITDFDSTRLSDIEAVVGDSLPAAPELTANISLTHIYDFGNGWGLNTNVNLRRQDDEYKRLNNSPANFVEGYTLLNARMEVASENGLSLYAYVRNLTDEVYFTEFDRGARLVGEPRTFGAGVRYSF